MLMRIPPQWHICTGTLYSTKLAAKNAVDNALLWLEGQQLQAEARVIQTQMRWLLFALASMGIDSHGDTRFIKTYKRN